MAGWELMPPGSGAIEESKPYPHLNREKPKVLGRFSHCRVDRDGALTGLKIEGGPEMRITAETITVEGYEKPWTAVTRMGTNENRRTCAAWVWQLVCGGKFEAHREKA